MRPMAAHPRCRPARRSRSTRRPAGGFVAGGMGSFVREQGDGGPVVLLHGVPTSSFLYRKSDSGPRRAGACGRSLSTSRASGWPIARSASTTRGLVSRGWTGEAMDALEIERCHLVVHDIGGPIGCEWAVAEPERVLSLTALNTLLGLASFRRPWSMAPFAVPGSAELAGHLDAPGPSRGSSTSRESRTGSAVPRARDLCPLRAAEARRRGSRIPADHAGLRAHARPDSAALWAGLARRPYPARIVWGERDPAIGLDQMRAGTGGARSRRADPAARQALPPGGPADGGRTGDRRSRGAARIDALGRGLGPRPVLHQSRSRPAREAAPRRGRSRAAPRHAANSSRASASTSRTS